MINALTMMVLLSGCYATQPLPDRPRDFAALQLGEQVPTTLLIEAADALEPCMGRPYDLVGWSAWIVVDSYECVTGGCFACPLTVMPMCGPPPPGYTEETAPCSCAGVTDYESKRIALAPDLGSLRHEVVHAGWLHNDPRHEAPEWQRCL